MSEYIRPASYYDPLDKVPAGDYCDECQAELEYCWGPETITRADGRVFEKCVLKCPVCESEEEEAED